MHLRFQQKFLPYHKVCTKDHKNLKQPSLYLKFTSHIKWEIVSNCVAFLENLNFTKGQ